MSARGFRSVGWVAGVAATALGCYMISLQVASTRASLEDVETQIVIAQRDIRVLQTEIGTRGRLAQLEKWNVKVLALSAPQANQFLEGGFQLASMVAPRKTIDPSAPVVLAAAPAAAPKPVLEAGTADETPSAPAQGDAKSMMHVASLKRELPVSEPKALAPKTAVPATRPATEKNGSSASVAGKTKADEKLRPSVKPATDKKAPDKKAVDKPAVTKTASADSASKAAKSKESPVKSATSAAKPSKSKEAKPKQ